jgi:anti-sigma B factor antagonist
VSVSENGGRPGSTTCAPSVFSCTSRAVDEPVTWVSVAGELDLMTAPQLDVSLRAALGEADSVVADLRHLEFMDCSGLHVLVDAAGQARQRGRSLRVARGPANVDRVFELTGTAAYIGVFDAPAAVGLSTIDRGGSG